MIQTVDSVTIQNMNAKLHDGFSTPVYVHFTTWRKRDRFVPEMLSYFSSQTFRPTKIVCWLSISEYRHTIPPSIQECLDRHLLDEVCWVRGNTYCHKRWEAFKYYTDGYNLLIDDDIYYPHDHVETLLTYSLAYPHAVVCYYGRRGNYIHGKRFDEGYHPGPSLQNELFSGASCFAPGLLPQDVLHHRLKRTLYCRQCDDSWVKAWLIKCNVPVVGCREMVSGCFDAIKDSQQNGIWETVNGVRKHGVLQKYINLCDALYHIGAVSEGERVWPDMDIHRYRTSLRTRFSFLLPTSLRRKVVSFSNKIINSNNNK